MGPVKDGKRAEDRSFWFRMAYFAEKYKILVWAVVLFLLAFGFDFKTPAQAMGVLQQQINVLRTDRDTLISRQNEIRRDLKDMKFLICLDHPEQSTCHTKPGA